MEYLLVFAVGCVFGGFFMVKVWPSLKDKFKK